MKIHMSKNEKNKLASVKFNTIKAFDFNLINDILQIDEFMVLTNKNESQWPIKVKSTDIINLISQLAEQKEIWYVYLFDVYEGTFEDNKVVDYLINNKMKIFIDLNLPENEVHILINLKMYNEKVYQKIKQKLLI